MKLHYIAIIGIAILLSVIPASAVTWTSASGCWTATDGDYKIVMWNTTGTHTFTFASSTTASYVVVAGGGGGGSGENSGGGGGAGGFLNGTGLVLSGTETIVVGAGGAGATYGGSASNGQNSSLANENATIEAKYGGAGGKACSASCACGSDGQNGGSGGGAGADGCTRYAGSGAYPQGFNGGNKSGSNTAGGGGGAGGVGTTNGGACNYTYITGTSLALAGGGGGGYYSGTGGSGGCSIGGAGVSSGTTIGGYGINGTGSGGGGGGYDSHAGGLGGSGVVIIRYAAATAPIVSFTANKTSGYSPLAVMFNDTSTPYDVANTYEWVFNNVSPGNATNVVFSTSRNVTQVFGIGNFNITLQVTNSAALTNISGTITFINVTIPAPVSNFTPLGESSGMEPYTVQFNDTSTGTPTSWSWAAKNVTGNNTWFLFNTTRNASHSFGAGNFTINLTTSNYGGSNISTQTSWVNVSRLIYIPIPSFSKNKTSGEAPLAVLFTDTSTNRPAVWNWSVNASDWSTRTWYNYTTSTNLEYTFSTPGIYNVSLSVQNITESPTINTTASDIYVNTTLAADFVGTPLSGYSPQPVAFVDYSTGEGLYNWSWNFGDGSTSYTRNPTHTYTAAGVYDVSLTVTGYDGTNTKTSVAYVTIATGNTFTANQTSSGVYGLPVQFNDTAPVGHTAWNWSFGDGYYSTSQNASHIYSVAHSYPVSLTVTDPFGTNTSTKLNYINLTSDSDIWLKSRLHMNGAAGGTSFVDEQGNAWLSSGVTTEATQVKFGNASAYFDANNDKLTTSYNSKFNFTTEDFTIEQWVYPTSSGTNYMLVGRAPSTLASGWGVYHTSGALSTNWKFFAGGTGGVQTGIFTLPLNAWHHLAIQRTSGMVTVYVDGNPVTTTVSMPGNYDTINPITYGSVGGGTSAYHGYIDETSISNRTRWAASFSPPHTEYAGNLSQYYVDANPLATLRFKTNPGTGVYISNLTPRWRTPQVQNITYANNLSFAITYNSDTFSAGTVIANTTHFPNVKLVSSHSESLAGGIGHTHIEVSDSGGFATSGLTENRGSLADVEMIYYNYTQPSDASLINHQYFSDGYALNSTSGIWFPIENYIATNASVYDWVTFSGFTASNTTPTINEQSVTFISELNYTANRFDWDFGDGTYANTTTGIATHTYTTIGAKNVSLRAYLWQNNSVTNTTTKAAYISPAYNYTYVHADFSGIPTSGSVGLAVRFTDLSEFGSSSGVSGRTYNWSFGDDTISTQPYSSTAGDVSHVYSALGTYTVTLRVNNTYGNDTETKTNYVIISASQQSTWYTQHLVKITAVNTNGNPIPDAKINATFMSSSLPNTSISWLQSAFGISEGVAGQMADGSYVMSDYSGADGSTSFMMFPGFRYQISVTNTTESLNYQTTIHPSDSEYIIYCPTTTANAGNSTYSQIGNTSLFVTEPNMSYVTFNFRYQDLSSLTSTVYWSVMCVDNETTMYSNTFILPGTSLHIDNYTVPNVRGQQWKFWYNATRSARS